MLAIESAVFMQLILEKGKASPSRIWENFLNAFVESSLNNCNAFTYRNCMEIVSIKRLKMKFSAWSTTKIYFKVYSVVMFKWIFDNTKWHCVLIRF